MNIRRRIIPTLLIDDGNLVKTKQFKHPNYLGDPINAIKIFNEKGVDELCILDISASKNGKEPDFDLIQNMASESFMPIAYGGGITSFNQIKKLFRSGIEKVIINTAIFFDEGLIKEAVSYFGSQSIVASIDYKNTLFGKKCFSMDGNKNSKISPLDMAVKVQDLGVGEILLYSIDHDGKRVGYDIDTIKTVVNSVNIPIIACGGAKNLKDISSVFQTTNVSAVAAGSIFVYWGNKDAVLINYPDEKEFINEGIFENV